MLGSAIRNLASEYAGVNLTNFEICELDGKVVTCEGVLNDSAKEDSYSTVISIFNPNIDSQRGFFLRVPSKKSKAEVKYLRP